MKPDLKRLVGTGWALAAALVVVACAQVQPPSFTPMATIPTERRTHCLGRFLIDLPADFQQDSGPALTTEFYYGLDKDFETVYPMFGSLSTTTRSPANPRKACSTE